MTDYAESTMHFQRTALCFPLGPRWSVETKMRRNSYSVTKGIN